MELLHQLFPNLTALSGHAQLMDHNITIDDLRPSGLKAQKTIEALLGANVIESIIQEEKDDHLFQPLLIAMANATLAGYAVFSAYHQRKAGSDVYKYEVEQMIRSYKENYYAAMDTLLQELIGKEVFAQSRYAKLAKKCKIQTADEFDLIYPIDLSYHFFFRTLPLQCEALGGRVGGLFANAAAKNADEELLSALRLALCKKTVAIALRRFDILEFPPTIRNLFDESHASRSGKDESGRALSLADQLDGEVDGLLDEVSMLLGTDGTLDVSSWSGQNRPDDKIVMMP